MISSKYKKLYDEFIKHYEKVHVNPWHQIDCKELKNMYDGLVNSMDIIDDYTFDYFINYIIKRLSGLVDAHTQYVLNKQDFLPIRFKFVEDQIYVLSPEKLKGYKLVSINDIDISFILDEFDDVVTYGTNSRKKYELERCLYNKYKLFSIPLLRNSDDVIFQLESIDGNIVRQSYNKNKKYELNLNPVDKNATYEIRNNLLIYYHYSVQKNYEEKINESIELLNQEDLSKVDRIIIDLRGNTGGNASLNNPLMDFLNKHLNKKILVLTDYRIFSGGRYALIDLIRIGAVTIGDEISTPINCYGNNNWINVDEYYFSSSEKFLFPRVEGNFGVKTKEEFNECISVDMLEPIYFKPDILVMQTLSDFIDDKDTVLEYAINKSFIV